VKDTAEPVITVPADITVEQATANGTVVNFTVSAVDICDASPDVTAAPPSGSMFPLGTTVVTVTAVDDSSNTATQTFKVIVKDTTAPVITLNGPAAMTLEANIDTYTEQGATVKDICDTGVTVVIDGDTVDATTPGVYVVTYDATDASGNAAIQLTRTVTVIGQNDLKLQAIAKLLILKQTADKKEVKKIAEAIKKVTESLEAKLWESPSTLTKYGNKVFDRERDAVKHLNYVEGAQDVIAILVHVDESLALVAIADAQAALPTGDPRLDEYVAKKIAYAQKEMAKAAEELAKAAAELAEGDKDALKKANDHYAKAIEHYKHAWKKAMEALKKAVQD
jgi:hypothetical protein